MEYFIINFYTNCLSAWGTNIMEPASRQVIRNLKYSYIKIERARLNYIRFLQLDIE